MPTNWITIAGSDLAIVLNLDIIKKANQNLDPDSPPDTVDTDEANRRDEIVAECVAEVRASIQNGGRYPLSVTANTVPPGTKRIILGMAAWQLINSTPNLNMAILTEKGVSTPFAKFYDQAIAWLEKLRSGASVVTPTDPTGQDYLTAVSDSNPALDGIHWGDLQADDSAYDQGFVTTDSGVEITLPVDDMRTT